MGSWDGSRWLLPRGVCSPVPPSRVGDAGVPATRCQGCPHPLCLSPRVRPRRAALLLPAGTARTCLRAVPAGPGLMQAAFLGKPGRFPTGWGGRTGMGNGEGGRNGRGVPAAVLRTPGRRQGDAALGGSPRGAPDPPDPLGERWRGFDGFGFGAKGGARPPPAAPQTPFLQRRLPSVSRHRLSPPLSGLLLTPMQRCLPGTRGQGGVCRHHTRTPASAPGFTGARRRRAGGGGGGRKGVCREQAGHGPTSWHRDATAQPWGLAEEGFPAAPGVSVPAFGLPGDPRSLPTPACSRCNPGFAVS